MPHIFDKYKRKILPEVKSACVACVFDIRSLLLSRWDRMKPVVYGCEIHQRPLIRTKEQKFCAISVIVLVKVANKLQDVNTFLPPRVGDILCLSRMNDREQIGTRNNLAYLHVASIIILIRIINLGHIDPSSQIFLLLDFPPIQFLLALETVDLKEV